MYKQRRQLIGYAAALAAASVLPALAHGGGSGPSGGQRKASRPQLGTSAAIDAQGRLWVAQTEAAPQVGAGPALSNIVLAWSADEGKSWTRAGPVLAVPEPVEANGEGRPKLAFGSSGQMYLTFTRPLDKPHTGYIRFARSVDGGRVFSDPITVQRDLNMSGHRFDSIVTDRRGRIFIAWIDKRDGDLARAANKPYRGAALYYAVSSDDGASFGPDVRIADHCCECCRIALDVTPGGEVVAMWRHIFKPNIRDHAMAVLPPAGRPGPITRVSFDNWRIDACPHHGPSVAFDAEGRRHQVWFSGGDDNGGLFYSMTRPDGRAGKAVRLGGGRAEHGEVLSAGQTIAVVWKEFDGQETKVMARLSTQAEPVWQERVAASSSGTSDHPHLVRQGQAIWLVWRTEDDGIVVRKLEKRS